MRTREGNILLRSSSPQGNQNKMWKWHLKQPTFGPNPREEYKLCEFITRQMSGGNSFGAWKQDNDTQTATSIIVK